jgi:hypothetical protein
VIVRWTGRLLLGSAALSSGCATKHVVPSEVAHFCPESSAVRIPEGWSGSRAWPEAAFSKDAPADPTRLPECAPDDTSEKCRLRVPAGHWDRLIYWGEPPVTAFKGIVYRWVFRSSHHGTKIIRLNHVDGKSLLTVRAVRQRPEPDGSYWTWTRLRELTPADWSAVQEQVDAANVWIANESLPPRKGVYSTGSLSLEVYDGTRHRKITRLGSERLEFESLIELVERYAGCREQAP